MRSVKIYLIIALLCISNLSAYTEYRQKYERKTYSIELFGFSILAWEVTSKIQQPEEVKECL